MAIKLSGSVSRKVPIPGVEFSSQSFSAGMEIEINSTDANEVKIQLASLYASLNNGIDAKIAASQPAAAPSQPTPPPQTRNGVASVNRVAAFSNGNGKRVTATEAQQRAIFAICKSQNLDIAAVLADFNVADSKELHVKDASKLIDQLKARPAAR